MIKLLLLASAVSPLTLLAAAGAAPAETSPTGRDFGWHVSTYARTPGLGQGMNPGQHHEGFSSWVGSMPC